MKIAQSRNAREGWYTGENWYVRTKFPHLRLKNKTVITAKCVEYFNEKYPGLWV